jgi:dihydrofolate synthase / folylpolyglutamate synthase
MNYFQSLRYLNSFLNLERIHLQGSRSWNLKRMFLLTKWAGQPEKNFFPILIAGTKGKGSTGYFLESILRASRIPTGFYTSPHLEDPRERIRINGQMISEKLWAEETSRIRRLLSNHKLPKNLGAFTYFEMVTLLAMQAFKRAGIKIGIFEVGMGGRLDATNVLSPELVILTPIHLDHEAILGPTIARIAAEKAAIIKRKAHAVITPQNLQAWEPIRQRLKQQKAVYWPVSLKPEAVGLKGDYQRINAGAAQKAAELLRDLFNYPISKLAIAQGLKSQRWPGRFESIYKGKGRFLLDAAHNPISTEALVRNLRRLYSHENAVLVFGTARDKKSGLMLKALSRYFQNIVVTQAANPRSTEVETLLLQARGLFKRIYPAGSVNEALEQAKQLNPKLTVITGSFYLVGEARKLLRKYA